MASNWLRTRTFLSGRFAVVVVGLVLLVLVGGWVTYGTHVDPGTHVEQREVSSWSTTAEFTHAATVRESNPVYPVGTTLENRTAYFGSVAPILNGSLEYRYAATEGGNLTVATDAWLTFQRVERDRDGEIQTRYWETTRALDQRRVRHVGPGRTVRAPFSANVSLLANRSGQISEELGRTTGQTEALVHVDVALNGTVNGERISRMDRHTLPIAVGEVYRIMDPGTTSEEYATTRGVTVENTDGPLRGTGGPVLFAVSLLALVGVGLAHVRGGLELTDAEREYASYRGDRSDFDEWIHVISLPSGAKDLPSAEADSLADLVDFAIDTDNSVVEDPDDGSYHVIHDGYRYTYEPPTTPDTPGATPGLEPETDEETDAGEDPLAPDPQETDD